MVQRYDETYYEDLIFEIEGLYSVEYKGYSMRPHRHGAIEILYVQSGKCEVNIHNQTNQSVLHVPLLSNNFIVINAGVYHDLHVAEDVSCELKTIELKAVKPTRPHVLSVLLGPLLRNAVILRSIFHDRMQYLVMCDTVQLVRVITDIIYLYNRYKWDLPNDKYMLMQMKIGELLLKLNDCMPASGMSSVGITYIKQAQQLIRQRLLSPDLTPGMVAKEIGITKPYLMSLYQKHLGHTMLQEIQSLRIEYACSRILNTDEALIDIGFACGFNTRQSFFSNFKRYMGVSPSQFRSQHSRISTYLYAEFHDDEL